MPDFVFPASSLDDRQRLLGLLGDFWRRFFTEPEQVASLQYARAQEEKQTQQDYQELVDALSRLTVPLYHLDHWYQLKVRQSEIGNQPIRYGDGFVYGNQPDTGILYKYGDEVGYQSYLISVPEELLHVPLIFNRLTAPSLTLVHGVDFELPEPGRLRLNFDPFADARLPATAVYDGSEVVDQEITLWLYRSHWERDYIYNHFGYLVGSRKPSSSEYREFVNTLLDAMVQGTTQQHLDRFFAALTGNPVAVGGETVEAVAADRNYRLVITDQRVYRLPLGATVIVAAGDELSAGQQLSDTVTFYDFSRGETPDDLLMLHLDTGFLKAGFAAGLSFENRDVPLVVEEDVDGKTKVSFEIQGFPTDVEDFFTQLHERAAELGTATLAELLDVRGPDQETQPTAASLPATINPLTFLIENVLRYHVAAVRIKAEGTHSADFSLFDAKVLRRLIPPWQALILLLDVDAGSEDFTPDSYDEDGELVLAGEPIDEDFGPADYDEDVIVYLTECYCG